jgi:MOSC domain-containing protein YiiM
MTKVGQRAHFKVCHPERSAEGAQSKDGRGVYARVLRGGSIRIGAPIVELPAETIAMSRG